jgi:hypothetical protein
MAELSLRSVAATCLGLHGRLSVKRDVLGVHGFNNLGTGAEPRSPVRSLRRQLRLALHMPFVRLALVTVRPEGSDPAPVDGLQRDLDTANEIL